MESSPSPVSNKFQYHCPLPFLILLGRTVSLWNGWWPTAWSLHAWNVCALSQCNWGHFRPAVVIGRAYLDEFWPA